MGSVTIKDIAKLAGVSHTTVSRALNDSSLIHPETKERIKKIAVSLNYTPNFSARSLVLDRSYNLGLFFSTLHISSSSGLLYEAMRGVNEVVKDQYNLILRGIDDYKSYHSVNRRNFDGLIIMSQCESDQPFIEYIVDQRIPFVVLNRELDGMRAVNLVSDDKIGAYRMVEHLIRQGHRKIALIEGKEGFKSARSRREGYLEAMQAYQIPVRKHFIMPGNYLLESGFASMNQLLALPERPTAVFCCNDSMALGAIKAITEKGMSVPEDISIVGFDDELYSSFTTPGISTVRRPIEKISRAGAVKLLEMIDNKDVERSTVYFSTQLVIRDSVKRIAEDEHR